MEIPFELVEAKKAVEFAVLALPGVVGIGLGAREEGGELFDELAVRILVEDASQVPDDLPGEIGGVAVCVIERRYEPCGFPDEARYKDLRGGIKITQPLRGDGTMGAIVEDASTGELLGLSCYHVVGDVGVGFPDSVWQPTNPPLVAPVPDTDNLGEVAAVDFPNTPPLPFSPIRVSMTDSAVFHLDVARKNGRSFSRAIAGKGPGQPDLIPAIQATADPTVFQQVRKRGFKTGPTDGTITPGKVAGLWTTLNWPTGGPNAYLMEQVEILGKGGKFCDKGDSGSVVLDATEPTALGLLWGAQGTFGIMSLISNVEAHLGISMVWA
ncbi:S1 family peptidase [Nonomuraea sediminis]|uniref:S1 family peptidase n=1 Tax=Nonomuraea sediminis TaxID=2835864 RepID=UPI001BDCA088|nr:S1 family peptidase [Nonomuraea sediminis]